MCLSRKILFLNYSSFKRKNLNAKCQQLQMLLSNFTRRKNGQNHMVKTAMINHSNPDINALGNNEVFYFANQMSKQL